MNEIDLLRELRGDLPPARPEQRAAARAGSAGEGPAARQSRSHPSRPSLGGAQAAARCRRRLPRGAAHRASIGIFGGGGKVQPAVAEVLGKAAAVAATQEPVAPGPGQFLFTRAKSAYLSSVAYTPGGCRRAPCEATAEWSVLVPSEAETWVSFDDALRGRTRTVSGKPRFVSASQRAGWIAAGSPSLPKAGTVEDSSVSGSGMPFDASKLPTDPAALRELIEARKIRGVSGPPGEAETFTLIGDMLRRTYLPAAIRAAIYRLTAELPGVELLGEVEDPAGRPGIGIAFTDRRRGTRHELIFEPKTSALLGERESLVSSRAYGFTAPAGTVIGYATYLESKIVDSVGQQPPAGAGRLDMSVGCYGGASLHASTAILHGRDPVAVCAKLWREGVIGDGSSSHLVACAAAGSSVAQVFPGPGSAVCRRLGLVPWKEW